MKLHEGQVIKNYKELCKLLDVEPTKGKGRKYHIREFERYCKYRKEGHKFIVEEVYSEPKEKIDGRVNNGGNIANTKYGTLMDKMLINLLLEYDGYIEDSFSGVMFLLDFFTKEYEDLNKAGYKTFAEINNFGIGLTMTYHQKMNNIVKKTLETSLNRLARNGIITYEKRINIRERDFNEHLADIKTEIKIKKYETETYEEMDIKYYNRIQTDVNRRFKNKVSDKLNIMSYWNVYCFELIDKNIEPIEENPDELKKRLIQSIEDAVTNKKNTDEFGNTFYPYSYQKYKSQINSLTTLLWNIPESETFGQPRPKWIGIGNLNFGKELRELEQQQNKQSYGENIPF